MWVLLWQGNGHLSDYISSKLSWLEQPSKRFIWGIIGVVIYSPLAVYLLYNIILWTMGIKMDGLLTTMLIAVGITFMISFFLNAASFLNNWKKTALDAETIEERTNGLKI